MKVLVDRTWSDVREEEGQGRYNIIIVWLRFLRNGGHGI